MVGYEACTLCGRRCGVNRAAGNVGRCGVTSVLRLSRAALHMWEEPPVSGTRGSGTIFFSGCSLGCIFCQNREISHGRFGIDVPDSRLSDIFLELQTAGAHNVNLVTPTHYIPTVRAALRDARARGLTVPAVYNTSSFDSVDGLRALDGDIDVYLADLKYMREESAARLSGARGYPDVAKAAIAEMVRQKPVPAFDGKGLMTAGVIVRVLLLPGHVAEAELAVGYLHKMYGDSIYISLMNQYTPVGHLPSPLDRRVTRDEYRRLLDYADRIGVSRGFVQAEGTAEESFIPPFDTTGVLPSRQ